ncbi:MarR family transcriptional regulator [Xinfangfangia sp. D13-10-4-6]|uniref:MarR family winged helix-turn-helix transcriptional regulator n=1 Tax=Pseudogemmobacter hezensis TaxID=2737662 RepID=UPI0015541F4A|nr:MarR family transcriptional regulator [Pseudogemmobacter hezensis]NPD16655.1 MarR family transcriptional regulator [Pseudogemmobacter hezensis]
MADTKVANMLGALAIVLADDLREAVNSALATTGETAAAIIMLGAHPGLTIGEVAEALSISHSGAVRLIDRLERDGLVGKRPGADARTMLVELSSEGMAQRKIALRKRGAVLDRAVSLLDAQDEELLGRTLDKLLRGLLTRPEHGYRYCRMCDEDKCVPTCCPVEDQWERLYA